MKKLMHIIATPRGESSRTLKVSRPFVELYRAKHPGCQVDTLNLFEEQLPPLTTKRVEGKYVLLEGKDLSGELKEAWEEIVKHIERFLSADIILITTPMWNFGIPYVLKHYIDIIFQPKYLFQYTEKGVEGLANDKKMVVVSSRGGDYSSESMKNMDHIEPYLRQIFGFAGITDITFINAQPMDGVGAEVQRQKMEEARVEAEKAARRI